MEYVIPGGDKRFSYLADDLRNKGCAVVKVKTEQEFISALKERGQAQSDAKEDDRIGIRKGMLRALILPVPVIKENSLINGCEDLDMATVIRHIPAFSFVSGGILPKCVTDACTSCGISYYDYMKDDEVACKNAVATAEGAIADAFMLSDINMDGSKCLVTGYGRCAKVLAEKLQLLGAHVTITARSAEACLHAEFVGYQAVSLTSLLQSDQLPYFDYCFNTIPAPVLTKPIIEKMQTKLILIDIASKPGGCDFEALKERGICYRHSLGIPGRYSPKTSGEILAEAILKHLNEMK